MTTQAAVIGHPVAHSLSPVMHNAAYRECGLDWNYDAIDIEPGDVVAQVKELFAQGCGGLNVTMPHKDVAYEMSTAHGAAARVETVNTLIVDAQGKLHGYSTDGDGFVASLTDHDIELAHKNILVIGAGGASRAICDALVHVQANVFVTARKIDQAVDLIEVVMSATNENDVRGTIDVVEFSDRENYSKECSVIVNATPIGMTVDGEDNSLPVDLSSITSEHVIIDTIYHPLETEFLRQAREIGCTTLNGLGMLIHQGALAFTLMTGHDAPVAVMEQAIRDELKARAS